MQSPTTPPVHCSSHICSTRRRPRAAFVDSAPAARPPPPTPDAHTVPPTARYTFTPPSAATPPLHATEAAAGSPAPRAPRRNDDDGARRPGSIPLQDKMGLLLSLCSVLVSVQVLMPRVL
jgi:hypothetical protein